MMERIVLTVVLVAAVSYLFIRLRRSFRHPSGSGSCSGCPMAGGCGGGAREDADARTDARELACGALDDGRPGGIPGEGGTQ